MWSIAVAVLINVLLLLISLSCFPTAGDISGAVKTLRSLLLFYPSDKDNIDNLQLYYETLGGDTESQGTQPDQVPFTTMVVTMTFHSLTDFQLFSLFILLFMQTTYFFVLQEIVRYVNRSLQEKKLLYFGMESLDFSFIDPVSTDSKYILL